LIAARKLLVDSQQWMNM